MNILRARKELNFNLRTKQTPSSLSTSKYTHTHSQSTGWPLAASNNFIQPISAHQPTGWGCFVDVLWKRVLRTRSTNTHSLFLSHTLQLPSLLSCIHMHTSPQITRMLRVFMQLLLYHFESRDILNTQENNNSRMLVELDYKPPFASVSAGGNLFRHCFYSHFSQCRKNRIIIRLATVIHLCTAGCN